MDTAHLVASGRFALVEYKKFRFFRPFAEDEPIWHYNVKSSEYNGSLNGDLNQINWAYGSQTWPNQWPSGSAYPDYFVIGDLYTNVYEGSASLTDIRLYVPDSNASPCTPTVFLQTNNRIDTRENIIRNGYFLYQRDTGALEVWTGSPQNPGSVFWENGVSESIAGASYYTKLQGDSNLITWRLQANGKKRWVWKTWTANVDGLYSFGVACASQGGGVALYSGTPNQESISLWSEDGHYSPIAATTPRPVPPSTPSTPRPNLVATSSPSVSPVQTPALVQTPTSPDQPTLPVQKPTLMQAPSFSAQPMEVPIGTTVDTGTSTSEPCLAPVVFIVLYTKENKLSDDSYYLYQNINGNFELWEGTTENPGQLLWQSGQDEATLDVYYATLRGDGNLITRKVTRFAETPIWQTGSLDDARYSLELQRCPEQMIAITNANGATKWSENLLAPLVAQPTTEPTKGSAKRHRNKSSAPKPDRQFSVEYLVTLLLLPVLKILL